MLRSLARAGGLFPFKWPLALVAVFGIASVAAAVEDGSQYTDLELITPANVERLSLVHHFRTGDLSEGFKAKTHSFQATPVYWQGKLYVSTSSSWVVAFDMDSGETLWRFDAGLDKNLSYSEGASRGVSLWHGKDDTCPDRVFLGTLWGEMIALNALTGELCENFGDQGRVDLSVGIQNFRRGEYSVTSPVAVLDDRIIIGSAIGDNGAVQLENGIVRALDPVTGKQFWQWDPVPRRADDPARESWQGTSADITGAANAWAPISVDPEHRLAFIPTSSPSPDFFGGERLGDNHYANSVVALNVDTGEIVWHYQLVHHDIWDYDVPAEPSLMMLERDGKQIPAVIVVTKTGMMFGFHRLTGDPIYEITEKPVPPSDVPGEVASKTQPFSSIVFSDHDPVTTEDAFGLALIDKWGCEKEIESLRSEGIFTPPSLQGTIQYPSYGGGANWGGVSLDAKQQIAVVNHSFAPAIVKLLPRAEFNQAVKEGSMPGWQLTAQSGTPYGMARKIFLSSLGLPCTAPPWGKLTAIDLKKGEILWDQPFGTIEDRAPGFVPNFNWGLPNLGGPLTTATDLTFIGASMDYYARVYRTSTGEVLWDYRLPTSAQATPISFMHKGKQYFALAVGGHGGMDTPAGDHLMVFGLPE